MGIVFIMFAELWVTFFRHVWNNGSKLFKPKWHVPVQKRLHHSLLVYLYFSYLLPSFLVWQLLYYILMFSFCSLKFSSFLKAFRLLQLKHLLVNLKIISLRIALVFDILYYSIGLNFLAVR